MATFSSFVPTFVKLNSNHASGTGAWFGFSYKEYLQNVTGTAVLDEKSFNKLPIERVLPIIETFLWDNHGYDKISSQSVANALMVIQLKGDSVDVMRSLGDAKYTKVGPDGKDVEAPLMGDGFNYQIANPETNATFNGHNPYTIFRHLKDHADIGSVEFTDYEVTPEMEADPDKAGEMVYPRDKFVSNVNRQLYDEKYAEAV